MVRAIQPSGSFGEGWAAHVLSILTDGVIRVKCRAGERGLKNLYEDRESAALFRRVPLAAQSVFKNEVAAIPISMLPQGFPKPSGRALCKTKKWPSCTPGLEKLLYSSDGRPLKFSVEGFSFWESRYTLMIGVPGEMEFWYFIKDKARLSSSKYYWMGALRRRWRMNVNRGASVVFTPFNVIEDPPRNLNVESRIKPRIAGGDLVPLELVLSGRKWASLQWRPLSSQETRKMALQRHDGDLMNFFNHKMIASKEGDYLLIVRTPDAKTSLKSSILFHGLHHSDYWERYTNSPSVHAWLFRQLHDYEDRPLEVYKWLGCVREANSTPSAVRRTTGDHNAVSTLDDWSPGGDGIMVHLLPYER